MHDNISLLSSDEINAKVIFKYIVFAHQKSDKLNRLIQGFITQIFFCAFVSASKYVSECMLTVLSHIQSYYVYSVEGISLH